MSPMFTAIGGFSTADRNAIFKRAITLLFTRHRVVLRLPSEAEEAPLFVIESPEPASDISIYDIVSSPVEASQARLTYTYAAEIRVRSRHVGGVHAR